MKIEILGSGCQKCKQLFENTQEALKQLQLQAEISKVTDIDKIIDYGVMITPAMVIDGKVVLSGKVLSADEIKKILIGGKCEKNSSGSSSCCCN